MAQPELFNLRLTSLRVKATPFHATGTAALQTSLIVEPFTASGAKVLAASSALSVVRPGVSPHAVGTHTHELVSLGIFVQFLWLD